MATWTTEAIFALIDVKKSLLERKGVESRQFWESVSQTLLERGFEYCPKECKKRWEYLLRRYSELKASRNKVGTDDASNASRNSVRTDDDDEEQTTHTWPFFDAVDEVLGMRHGITPPCLFASSPPTVEPTSLSPSNSLIQTDESLVEPRHESAPLSCIPPTCPIQTPSPQSFFEMSDAEYKKEIISLIARQDGRMKELLERDNKFQQTQNSLMERLVTAMERNIKVQQKSMEMIAEIFCNIKKN